MAGKKSFNCRHGELYKKQQMIVVRIRISNSFFVSFEPDERMDQSNSSALLSMHSSNTFDSEQNSFRESLFSSN